jgi:hypothetical protein
VRDKFLLEPLLPLIEKNMKVIFIWHCSVFPAFNFLDFCNKHINHYGKNLFLFSSYHATQPSLIANHAFIKLAYKAYEKDTDYMHEFGLINLKIFIRRFYLRQSPADWVNNPISCSADKAFFAYPPSRAHTPRTRKKRFVRATNFIKNIIPKQLLIKKPVMRA